MAKFNEQNAEQLAIWMARNQPALFAAIARKSGNAETTLGSLWTAIGSGISKAGMIASTAVKSVGGFLANPSNMKNLADLGGVYLTTKAQKQALQYQMQQLSQGSPPADVEVTGNVATVRKGNKRVPLSSMSKFFSGNTPMIMMGLGLLGVVLLARGRARS